MSTSHQSGGITSEQRLTDILFILQNWMLTCEDKKKILGEGVGGWWFRANLGFLGGGGLRPFYGNFTV